MRLLLDEMYSPEIAAQLRRKGDDVVHAAEIGLASKPDHEVFASTVAHGRAIVTNDAGDYVTLFNRAAADGRDHNGILLTSDRSLPRSKAGIRRFVQVLHVLLAENPSDDALQNQLRWLP